MISIKSKEIYQKNNGITLVEILVVNLILGIILLVIFKFLLDIKRTSRNTQIINQLKNDMHYAMERIINGGYMDKEDKERNCGIIRASDIQISEDRHSIELTYNDSNSKTTIDGNSQKGKIIIYLYFKDANQQWEMDKCYTILPETISIYSMLIYDPNITFSEILDPMGDYHHIKIKLDLQAYFDPTSEERFHPPTLSTEIICRNKKTIK